MSHFHVGLLRSDSILQVLGTGTGTWNASLESTYNLDNPIYRDVFTVPKGGWATIRFVANNPGRSLNNND